ncbi:hypothetical protein [Dyadobacter fanqingshengii]|uniref:Uncharacterized protein n=1 Tax=Dyadobacter fanqingshengii TaxID=2906443 RepID=A0A9X1PGU5_9BACT|nr:hypothetical protein [Dyadobacter fanqingshengii]MCF0043633.1 hypothetical protein [Dyadobacter fanqingshengii]USJ34751.1 hypothetical protein NFI81_18810 [Dyadobacter fanqingshengii]
MATEIVGEYLLNLPTAVSVLKEIMEKAGVTKITVSSTNRTADEQVSGMYGKKIKGVYVNYAKQGEAVLKVYDQAKVDGLSKADTLQLMKEELVKQLPSAVIDKKLMHVNREKDFLVFDISALAKDFVPSSKLDEFDKVARQFCAEGKFHRFLGKKEEDPEAFHFEFQR